MRNYLLFALLFYAGTAYGAGLALDQIVSKIQSTYDQSSTYAAQFSQTYYQKSLDKKTLSSGKVYFKKPGMMRWDYYQPKKKQFYAKDLTIWIYEPYYNQVFKGTLSENEFSAALSFLMGRGQIQANFTVKPQTPCADANQYCLLLIPKVASSYYSQIIFKVDKTSFLVMETLIFDHFSNWNHFVFSGIKINLQLKTSNFIFTVPKGARIISKEP